MRTHVGQYRIEAPLGRGGMGVVYRGVHEHLGRPVAVKVLAPELTQQPEFKERFFAEAKTQARLQHPNIVGVYDLLADGGEYFIVMELVQGVGLDDRLKTAAGRGMETAEAVEIFSQVLAALDYAHSEGVIHRDIKPSNVMITAGGRVKLTDFGIALLIGDKRLTASQSAIGTPTYMSPEQILRPRSVDHRTDIYSAAVVFYEMLAGRPPFDDDTEYGIKKLHVEAPPPDLGALHPGLPGGVVRATAVALSKNPDDRFASAGLFVRALQEGVPKILPPEAASMAAPVYRPTAVVSLPAQPKGENPLAALLRGGNRWIALGGAALLLLLTGFGSVVLLLSSHGPEGEKAAEASVPPAATAPQGAAVLPAMPVASPEAGALDVPASIPPEPPEIRIQEKRPRRAEKPPAPRKKEPIPEPRSLAGTPPAIAEPEPSPRPATPEIEEPLASPEPAGIDRLKEMEGVVVRIVSLGERAFKAQKKEGRQDDLLHRLEAFSKAAVDMRKEFRRATGTGWRGTFSKVAGKSGDPRALEIKVENLVLQADEIDRLIDSGAPAAQSSWREARSHLRNLENLF